MIKYVTLLILFFFISVISAQNISYVEGELIVQFHYDISVNEFTNSYADIQMRGVRQLSQRMNIWLINYNPNGTDSDGIRFRVSKDNRVKLVQFNHYITLRDSSEIINSNLQRSTFPDDPMFAQQWGLHNTGQSGGTVDADIDAPESWDVSSGGVTALGDTIVIAIIDGGCQLNHPDLNYWHNWLEVPNNSIDDDGNGYIDDFRGWNAYNNNGNVPVSSHGTHVSGIAGAHGNNNIGVSGVNWNAQIMPVAGSSEIEATVVAAYSYVHELRSTYNETSGLKGAFVVATNSSFGVDLGQPEDYPIWCAMYDSLGVQGILSCGATANANWDIDVVGDVPTACPSNYMIAVTNTTRNDLKNSGAAYGLTTIDLGAPGTSILSTDTGGSYSTKTGTSMATPMVAGSIALMFAAADISRIIQYKNNLPGETLIFRDVLLSTVDSIASLQGKTVTGGRLNVNNSVLEISQPVVPVELVSFTSRLGKDGVHLNWITVTETNNYGFEIERTSSAIQASQKEWIKIGFINGSGSTTESKYYSFIDDVVLTGYYSYRLKQLDFDGSFEYSNIIELEVSIPDKFELSQNYPNPFNPSTTIGFTISPARTKLYAGGDLRFTILKVYDILGNEVATLVNEELPAGRYGIDFDASELTSGIYFYHLRAGGFTEVKKMIVIR
jgi:hypothetical protein